MTTAENVRQHIKAQPKGKPLLTISMMSLGPRASVDQALLRLAREGFIVRLARGVYVRPKNNRYVGQVLPGTAEIVKALAKAKGETIHTHGAEAALLLGLTTQVPMKALYYTNGPSRDFRIGNMKVIVKNVSSRLLALAGRPAGVAFSALWYMGREQVTPQTLAFIQKKLPTKEFAALRECPQLPAWLKEIFRRFETTTAPV